MERKRDPDAKREALHQAALRLFAGRPMADVSVAEIAREAGFAVGTFYRFYPGKGELLAAVSIELEQEFVAAMTEAWEGSDDYRAKLDRVAHAMLTLIAHRRDRIFVLNQIAGNQPSTIAAPGTLIRERIAAYYRDGQIAGTFGPHEPKMFAAAAFGVVEGLMQHLAPTDMAARHAENASTLSEMLARLAMADPARV